MTSEPVPDVEPASTPAARPAPLVGASLEVIDANEFLTHVALTGSLDLAGVERIGPAFNASVTARHRATILDLSGLEFISSLGLAMLVSAHRAAKLRGRPFVLVAPLPAVLDVLQSARLHQIMPIVGTLSEAMAAIKPTT